MFASFTRRLMHGFVALPTTVCVLAGFFGGCSGEDEVIPQLGRACTENADCGSGLVCARGGDFVGLCTASCTNTTDCETRFGDGAVCALDYCTLACDHTDECGSNGYCGVDLCFGGKAGLSDTCSGSSQCEPGLSCSGALNPSGSCVARCTTSADCAQYSPNADCVPSQGLCAHSCSGDFSCSGDARCHNYTNDEGFLSGYCG